MRALLATLALALLAGAAGCGGSSAKEPHEVVEAFLETYADGDGEEACSLLAEDARGALDAAAPGGCGEVVERLVGGFLPDEQRERLRETEARTTSTAGDRAVVSTSLEGASAEVVLRRVGDEWLIAEMPRFTGG